MYLLQAYNEARVADGVSISQKLQLKSSVTSNSFIKSDSVKELAYQSLVDIRGKIKDFSDGVRASTCVSSFILCVYCVQKQIPNLV